MPIYVKKITLTNANEGYSIATLLGSSLPTDQLSRIASFISITAAANFVFVVPSEGPYSNTGGIPDDYGRILSGDFVMSGIRIPLEELVIGTNTAGRVVTIIVIV